MYFVYVYIVLCFVGLLWVALGPHFAPWGDFAPPFGSLWGALGSQGVLLGVTLASLGLPWDRLGHLGLPRGSPGRHFGVPGAPLGRLGAIWGTLGSQGELGMTWAPKWTSNSEQMSLKYAACAQKVTSRNSPARTQYPPKVEQAPQLPTPLHSRRGLG